MTTKQKIELRLSQVRSRLNEIAGLSELTTETREEAATLEAEYSDLETRHRAAIISEGEAEAAAVGLFPDGSTDSDGAELRQLLGRVSLRDYLAPAAAGVGVSGAASELSAALELPTTGPAGGVAIPWRLLEERAFTTTANNDGPEMQRPILQRLFGPGLVDALGVRMDSVPVGRVEWPLITGGVAPAMKAETSAADAAVAATFAFANLKPKRLTGRYEYSHEMAASTPGIEQALRRDLADAVKSKMSDILVNGQEPDGSNPERIEGFISELGAATDLSTGVANATAYGRLHAQGVDAIHAMTERQVSSVIGEETYRHSAGVYIQGSGESGSELLARRSAGCIASSYLPNMDATSKKQSAILHASGPNGGRMRGDSVAAMWPTLEIIRDIYSQASQGVVLTWVSLWDARVAFRSAAYRHVAIQLETA